MDKLCKAIFSCVELQNSTQNDKFYCNQAILILCNDIVADFNQKFLDKLPRELYIYNSITLCLLVYFFYFLFQDWSTNSFIAEFILNFWKM